jgi:hypothetical protein
MHVERKTQQFHPYNKRNKRFGKHLKNEATKNIVWVLDHIWNCSGWKDGKFGLEPILFDGKMSSDFLQDLVFVVFLGEYTDP